SVDFALLGQPSQVATLGALLDLPKELNGLRFVARLARVIDRNDHLDLDRNHVLLGLNQSGPLDSLSGNTHREVPVSWLSSWHLRSEGRRGLRAQDRRRSATRPYRRPDRPPL